MRVTDRQTDRQTEKYRNNFVFSLMKGIFNSGNNNKQAAVGMTFQSP